MRWYERSSKEFVKEIRYFYYKILRNGLGKFSLSDTVCILETTYYKKAYLNVYTSPIELLNGDNDR